MATYTATAYARPAKAVHAGVNHIHAGYDFTGGADASAGDVVVLAKLPHGAKVIDVIEHHSSGASTSTFDVGLLTGGSDGGGQSLSAFVSAGGQGVRNARLAQAPFTVSVSDSAATRFGILAAKLAALGTATADCAIDVSVFYRVDE